MVGDDDFSVIRKDVLILTYGESEFQRLAHENRHYRNISDRIRELGRLLIAAKKIDLSVNRLSQLINANKYQLIKNSVKLIAGSDETTSKFKSPSLAIKIGITLKKCASILRGDYTEDDDMRELIPQIDAFLGV
ncbi:hypothetical protein JTB14_006025 [Gonioctena quinquepunctata]|nr:hypothetical protein JTB14_006025 [Gonioctena quinquepunctata]